MDRENVIKGLETIKQFFGYGLPSTAEMFDSYYGTLNDAIALLKEQKNEKKRIMKVIWDTLHETHSLDTVADQDWLYTLLEHRMWGTNED